MQCCTDQSLPAVVTRRDPASHWSWLTRAGEPPLPAHAPVLSITVHHPPRYLRLLGMSGPWWVWFFLFACIAIAMSPVDRFIETGASTPFYRSFIQSFPNITVTAPSTHVSGGTTYLFHQWAAKAIPGTTTFGLAPVGQLAYTIGTIGVQADTVEARYLPARTLTVQSTNPATGVSITVSPADFDGAGNGTTAFSRRYRDGELVSLTAPATVGFNPFKRWSFDGTPQAPGQTALLVVMGDNHTVVAEYWNNVAGSISNVGVGCRGSNGNVPSHTVTWPAGQQGRQGRNCSPPARCHRSRPRSGRQRCHACRRFR